MYFLGFGRPQPTSEEKIGAVEAEMKLLAEMHTRYDTIEPSGNLPTPRSTANLSSL